MSLSGRPKTGKKIVFAGRHKLAAAISASLLWAGSAAHAHGGRPGHIDEGPGPGTWITVVMVVSWIVIALGVVFFVRRLISGGSKKHGGDKKRQASDEGQQPGNREDPFH